MTITQDSKHPTGVSDSHGKDHCGKEVTRARNRKANAALVLVKYGASWDEVAETLGYPTARHAKIAVERALENETRNPETKAFVRRLISEQYDAILEALMPFVKVQKDTDGNPVPNPESLPYIDRALKALGQKSKLHGADAPTEFLVSSPTTAQIEQWISDMLKIETPDVPEADIFGEGAHQTVPGTVVSNDAVQD